MDMEFLMGLGLSEEDALKVLEMVRQEIAGVYAQAEQQMALRERGFQVREFLMGMAFVNEATRAYYEAKLNEALALNPLGDLGQMFAAMTTGADGAVLPNLFAAAAAELKLPPGGAMEGNRGGYGELNTHRIVK